ncbi:MAG: TetR/AcrR family transcriptional regulator [Sphingobium sp.]|jgi:AcrR family transcriptional regulator
MGESKQDDAAGGTATPVERDWIAAAREMLIEGGISAVQINPLAARLGVTRGGFYWRFKNRQDLLDHLLREWRDGNVRAFLRAADRAGTPVDRYRRIVRLWMEGRDFDAALDSAIRQWGRVEPDVAEQVLLADEECIAALARIFVDARQDEVEATVRARIVYFHQIGYWALGIRETQEQRRALAPVYTRLLTGFDD